MPLEHVFEIPVEIVDVGTHVITSTKVSNGIRAIRGDSLVEVDVKIYNDLVRGYNEWASMENKKERNKKEREAKSRRCTCDEDFEAFLTGDIPSNHDRDCPKFINSHGV